MLQNLHARVQTFPSSRKVAVPEFQHSFRFGHAALWQTVWSARSRTTVLTAMYRAPVESGTLNQGGSRRTAVRLTVIGRRFRRSPARGALL
jgi:hypothetical protein